MRITAQSSSLCSDKYARMYNYSKKRREEKARKLDNKRKSMGSPFTTVLHKCQTQMTCACSCTLECVCKCYERADRLSGLPDEILVSILSLLKLKEAARTCILSQRWKNLWLYSPGTLDFYYSDGRLRLVNRQPFVAWVNHVLSVHQGSTIDEFEVSCALYGRIKQNYIDEWVEFALKKNVKRLKLDFRGKIASFMGSYSLMKPLLHKYNLESLTVLSLRKVEVTSEVIQYILFKCPLLEVLCVEGSSSLVELNIPASLSQLKCVEIKTNEMKCLEISAVNIKSFTYHGYCTNVTFEKVPHLVEASFGRSYASFFVANIGQFSSCIRQLELLMLDLKCCSDLSLPQLPIFENLRQLELLFSGVDAETVINICASWLEICPVLRRFVLEACPKLGADHHKDWSIEGERKCLHGCLRVFEMLNVNDHEEDVIVACSIVSTIPSLEQVIVHPFCSPMECLNDGFKEKAIEFAKRLEKVMQPATDLIVV